MKKLMIFAVCALLALTACSCKKNTAPAEGTDGAPVEEEKKTFETMKLPVPSDAAANACGDKITWSFDEATCILEISGEGRMWDYIKAAEDGTLVEVERPWNVHNAQIKTIVIGEGVIEIGDNSFLNCTSLENVTIAKSVKGIGVGAFAGCSALVSVDLSEGLELVEDDAFIMCKSLKEVNFAGSREQWKKLDIDSNDFTNAEIIFAK